MMKCPVSACALETEGAPTHKVKQPPPSPHRSSWKTLLFPLESSFWLKTEPCLVSASFWLLTGQHYVTDKLSSCERIDKQPALTSRPWISLTSLIWASPPHKLDLNVDPSVAHISASTHICASSRRMRWPKRDVFRAALSVFFDECVAFSCVCAVNMIARTERRRKASDGRPCYLNFGPLSSLNSNFCLQGENFSPFICIKEKNILQYYLVFSQASVHASLSVSMCGLFCLLWPLVFFNFLLVIQWKFLMYVIDFALWRFEHGKSSWTCESSWRFLCVYLQDIVYVSRCTQCD